jgi:chromate transport protein ChrA
MSAEEVEEIPVHRNGRISVQAIRTGHVVSTWQLQQSRYRRQTWTDRALVAVLMLGLGVSVSVVLFAGGFLFWLGMRAAESLIGRL